MFTGIVEELGRVRAVERREGGARIEVEARTVLDDATAGASIAVNGCCLTVVELASDWWAADVVGETLARTTLGGLRPGDPVNLERPVAANGRFGGHVVQGHVDGVGTIIERTPSDDGGAVLRLAPPPGLMHYVVEKGSIAVDGISLTVAVRGEADLAIAVIPHTLAVTTLGSRAVGDPVNLEVDVLAKYVEQLLDRNRRT